MMMVIFKALSLPPSTQGHHGFDGHAGFVTAMVPLPRDGALLEERH